MATAAELRKRFGIQPAGKSTPAATSTPESPVATTTPSGPKKSAELRQQFGVTPSATPAPAPKPVIKPATIQAAPKKNILERGVELLDKKTGGMVSDIFDAEPKLVALGRAKEFIPFIGSVLKPKEDKVIERYDRLVASGTDPERATTIAVADVIGSPTARFRMERELGVTKEERKAMSGVKFGENLDFAFGTLDVVSGGAGSAARKTISKLAKEVNVPSIVKTLRKEFGWLKGDAVEETAQRLADAKTEEAVEDILREVSRRQESGIPRGAGLSEEAKRVEDAAIARVEVDEDAIVKEYIEKNKNVINTDEARELFPAYRKNRTLSAAVHEPSSYVAKKVYDSKLATEQGVGNNTVLFTAGGTGAGKTTAVNKLKNVDEFPIIYDTNMSSLAASVAKIEKALDRGFNVDLTYIYNEPSKALDNALSRAERQRAELGSGRTVPIDEHIQTHLGSNDVYRELAEKYKGDERVQLNVIDNSQGANPTVVDDPVAFLAEKRYSGGNDELKRQLTERINTARGLGRISDDTAGGFLGKERTGAPDGAGDGGRLEGGRNGSGELETSPGPQTDTPVVPAPASRSLPRSTPVQIPGKADLKKPGLQGVMRSFDSFSRQLDNNVNPSTRKVIEQDLPIAGPKNPEKTTLFQQFRHGVGNSWNFMREQVQDDMLRVKQLVDNPEIKVSDASDPYQAEILFHGRVGTRLEEADNIVRTIDRDVLTSSEKLGVSDKVFMDQVNDYLHALHVPERNAALGEGAAGMKTDEALALVESMKGSPAGAEVRRVADRIRTLHTRTLDVLKEGEVISDELYDTLRSKYKNHVPLYRVFEGEEDMGSALGRGFDVRGTGIKRAKGSKREVAPIFENVVEAYKQAVIRSEKNRVDLATLKMVRDNSDAFGDLFKVEHPRAIGRTFSGEGKEGQLIMENVQDPNVLVMREKGKPVHVRIQDPNLASALKGVGREKLSSIMRGVGAITRFYSGLQTRFNPEFAFPNKIRDLQEVMVYASAQGELGAKGAGRIVAREAKLENERAVLDFITGRDSEGAKLYKQMKDDGGTTGGLGLSTREQVKLDIEEVRKLNRSKPREAMDRVIRYVDYWNTIFEDSTRLSVYREAIASGATRQRAARLAKEASVNFNKAGKAGPVINALYMFSNASIQGSAKMLMAMKNPKVAAATVAAVAVPVATVNTWNDFVDPEWRDKVTEWDRLNGLPVMLPKEDGTGAHYITIPISWGIKPIKVMADKVADLAVGKGDSLTDSMAAVLVSVLEGYNPAGGTDLVSAITPTVLDIPVEIGRNQSWNGGKIRPDWDQNAPADIQYFETLEDSVSGRSFIALTKGLSGIGMEVSPADLNYSYEQLIGGAGRSAGKVVDTVTDIAQLKLPEAKEVPVISRFYKSRSEEEVGAGSGEFEDIKKILEGQSRERFVLKQRAEDAHNQLKNLPPEEARARFDQIKAEDKELAAKISEIAKAEKKNLNYTDRLILDLGVANGERAQYVKKKLDALDSDDQRRALWEEYVDKGILTKEVRKQLNSLRNEPQP